MLIKEGNVSEGYVLEHVAEHVLSQSHWQDHPELLEMLLERGDHSVFKQVTEHVLQQSSWEHHPRLLELSGGEVTVENLLRWIRSWASQAVSLFF